MDRLEKLREAMKKNKFDYYIIPSSDPHQSEYVPDTYKGRAYISGFTGSAGTLLVGKEEAFLWTDGRYFIQAERELEGSGIKLMKMRTEGYPSLEEWIEKNIKENEILAFDGKVISKNEYLMYKNIASRKNFNIDINVDVLDEVWEDRPRVPMNPIFIHDIKFAGKSTEEKLSEVRREMEFLSGENYIITSLDDIAWLFNIRGNDINYNPVCMSYAIVSKEKTTLYIDPKKVLEEVRLSLEKAGVILKDYFELFKDVKKLEKSVIIDGAKVSAKIFSLIGENVKIIDHLNITTTLKGIKNKVEIENIEKSQIRDGVAMVKFTKWLKENIGKVEMSEISASDKLEEFRSKGENFKGLSFNTIAGYKSNAAMMHYSATKESDRALKNEGMLLIDSGAQYLDGTTDITRTFVLGKLTDEEKRDFTLVLKGHINLASTVFLKGSTGINLDSIARRPLWAYGIDYKCGTGHGVGFYLNVHEGPHGIRPKGNSIELKPGMIVTNEPGVYKEGKHGIRTENIMVVEELSSDKEMGEFYKFRTITYAPIDLEGIDSSLLNNEEKNWLNSYHKEVYDKISPYLDKEEREFLRGVTKEIR